MSWLLVPAVGTVLCWLSSLRRTPWPVAWLFPCVIAAGPGMVEVAGALAVHHTLTGMIAVSTGALVPPAVFAFVTEADAANSTSSVAQWRAGRSRRTISRDAHKDRWRVITKARALDDGNETVWVGVASHDRTRWIGHADPITDMDAFMNLRAKADQAAETLNALKIDS